MAEIIGRKIDLPNARSVFVGHRDFPTDEKYYIQFKNGNSIQRFTLSEEAARALLLLLSEDDRGEAHSFSIDEGSEGTLNWRWQVVKDKDA